MPSAALSVKFQGLGRCHTSAWCPAREGTTFHPSLAAPPSPHLVIAVPSPGAPAADPRAGQGLRRLRSLLGRVGLAARAGRASPLPGQDNDPLPEAAPASRQWGWGPETRRW